MSPLYPVMEMSTGPYSWGLEESKGNPKELRSAMFSAVFLMAFQRSASLAYGSRGSMHCGGKVDHQGAIQ
jgi:hypothetical protein